MLKMLDAIRNRIGASRLNSWATKLLKELNKESSIERNMSEELQKLFAPYRRQTPANNRQILQEAKPKPKRQQGWFPMFSRLPTLTH